MVATINGENKYVNDFNQRKEKQKQRKQWEQKKSINVSDFEYKRVYSFRKNVDENHCRIIKKPV
jgi:hypothetical protein